MSTTTDVVIIGGGLAGFAAALQAAEEGLSVLLIEKCPVIGGSTALSSGCMAFAGTDLQAAAGVVDGDDLLHRDLREVGAFENDEALVDAYVAGQLDTYRWLVGHGVAFSPSIEASSGQSVPRVHTVDPADMVRLLDRRCRATGRVEVWTSTAAKRLFRDGPDGRVTGVEIERGGAIERVEAGRAVILACGGFVKNPELIHRFVPALDQAIFVGGEGNVGDGLRMARALGADFRDVAHIKGTYGKHPFDERNNHPCLAVYKGAIAVNQDGRRYVDESISYKLLGDACLAQPYGCTYQILDRAIFEEGDDRVRILDFGRRLEDGLMLEADTLDRLAEMIEVPADVLARTVADYNDCVATGRSPAFGRRHLVHHHGELVPIMKPPFYAYPSAAAVYGTYCGVCVDPTMTVLDVFGAPIVGLLAAGEMVGGLHGAAYMTGSSLGKAAIFGRIAARTAAGLTARGTAD